MHAAVAQWVKIAQVKLGQAVTKSLPSGSLYLRQVAGDDVGCGNHRRSAGVGEDNRMGEEAGDSPLVVRLCSFADGIGVVDSKTPIAYPQIIPLLPGKSAGSVE